MNLFDTKDNNHLTSILLLLLSLCMWLMLNLTVSLFLFRPESSLDPLVQVLEVLITSELNMNQAAPGRSYSIQGGLWGGEKVLFVSAAGEFWLCW